MKIRIRNSVIKYSAIAFATLIIFKITAMEKTTATTPSDADAIVGKWKSEAKDSEMAIYKTGNTYSAKMLAGWGHGVIHHADGTTLKKDTRNFNARLRNRPLLNMEFLTGLRYEDGGYTGGRLYSSMIGMSLSCKIKFEGDKLVLRMYAGFPFLGTSKKWSRFSN